MNNMILLIEKSINLWKLTLFTCLRHKSVNRNMFLKNSYQIVSIYAVLTTEFHDIFY